MQPRQLWVGFALAVVTLGLGNYTTLNVTAAPSSTTTLPCTRKACATYTNEYGQPYGGCFPACPGNTVAAFTPPPCPTTTTTTTPSNTSTACPTVCWDLINSCSMWYGGCYPMCGPYSMPFFTPPPCPSSTSSTSNPASITGLINVSYANRTEGCSNIVCWDYQNDCGIKYGGCHTDCPGVPTPSYTNPGCPFSGSITKSFTTRTKSACCMYCPQYVDGCGNTFGPGCYTSCPGVAPPSFTTPYCETSAMPTLNPTTTSFWETGV